MRRAQLLVLCEDTQHEAFVRRFLEAKGYGPRTLRVEKSPRGKGSGEHWVRERYPVEVKAIRQAPHVARGLVVVIDGDTMTCDQRISELEAQLASSGQEGRAADEPIGIFVPRRNIETWIAYLHGADVDEDTAYPRLQRESDCAGAVRVLSQMCDRADLRAPSPDSLRRACVEYRNRIAQARMNA